MKIHRTQEGSETWDGDGNITELEIRYYIVDPTCKQDAMEAVLGAAPKSIDAGREGEGEVLELSAVRFELYDDEGNMEISALYKINDGSLADTEDSPPTFSFDCSGGSKHLTHAIRQVKVYPQKEEDDTGGAIGWNGKPDDPITGVDVPTGQLRETYTKTMKMSAITTARKRAWNSLVGKVNSSAFKGWAPGEVMFLGCSFSGSNKSSSKITVQFYFSIQENEDHATVAGLDCGEKKGFEVIWASSKPKNENKKAELVIKGVYVAQVCENGDFGILGV